MNKSVIATLVLLVATWQLTECEADGLLGTFGKVTEKIGEKTVKIGEKVKEDVKVVKETITTLLTGQKNKEEHKEDIADSYSGLPVVPTSQPQTHPNLSDATLFGQKDKKDHKEDTNSDFKPTNKPTTTETSTQDPRFTINSAPRCLPGQDFIAGACHERA
uniref:Navisecapin-1 n=1 Tax=Nasonia vitripennis TaxID=7425 RepID=F6K6F1_NASVI|nr:navisecapin-1 [Nasonia vitripennis]